MNEEKLLTLNGVFSFKEKEGSKKFVLFMYN